MRARTRSCRPSMPAPISCCTPPAGWRAAFSASYEKFIMDFDQLGAMHVLAKGVDMSENGQRRWRPSIRSSPAAISSAAPHTQANFETAFYRSSVADNNSVEQWEAEGKQDAPQRANRIWKKMLAEYEAPAIDPGVDEALRDAIERKKASMPDAMY